MSKIGTIITLLVLAAFAIAQTPPLPVEDAGHWIAGEHFPVIYSGTGVIQGAAHPCTTAWYQVGYSEYAASSDNRNIGVFNPQYFTAGLKLACSGDGDSAQISSGYFETSYDTSTAGFWNSDSSNRFIEDGIYGHDDYGIWRFESLSDTSRTWVFPLRLYSGGFVRLILDGDLADTTSVSWSLICEH